MPLSTADLRALDELTQQALDLPLAARAAWIDALPPPHDQLAPLLRENLLAEGLPGDGATDHSLGSLPPLPARQIAADAPVSGERVGPYELIRPLGEGGMSSVWLAARVEGSLRREVALKLPHRHLLDRGLAARMQRERDILASLNHDSIARLFEAGVDEGGNPYLALEYVQGEPINAFCERTSIDLHGRVRLMVQVARAVAHAHANLVVHRDLKPSNILVTTGDAASGVKLLDFGIAKLLTRDDDATHAPDLTQTLGRALTPDYASPEQFLEQPVTTASDIYSLGVVLYEVVAGEKPYKLKRQSAAALAEAVLHADVVRPSRRCAQGARHADARRVEGDLDAIILKALKVVPAERYATASALADDLERFLQHQPVMAQPDSVAYRTRRFVQRHALLVGAGVAVSVAMVSGATIALWQAQQARLETAKTRAVKDFLQSIITLGSVDQQDALVRQKQPIGDVLLDAARSLPGRFADQPEVRAEVQGLLGNALGDLYMLDSAKVIHESRVAELNARDAPIAERMEAQVALAAILSDTGEAPRAARLIDEAAAALDGRRDNASRIVLAHALRERSLSTVMRFDGSSGVADAAKAAELSSIAEPGTRNHVAGQSLLAFAHAYRRDLANAGLAFDRAIELAQRLPPSERAFEAEVRRRYAEALITARQHARALVQLREALAIVERTSGRETFRWARTAVVTANLTAAAGDTPRAMELYEQVLRNYRKFGAELDPLFMSAANALSAHNLAEYGLLAEALQRARAGFEPYREPSSAHTAGAVWLASTRYANALIIAGEYGQAEKLLQRALQTARAGNFSRANSDMTTGERLLALTYLYRGRYAEAEALLKDIISVDGAPVGRFINQRNFSRLALVRAYLEQGRLDAAEAEIRTMDGILGSLADDDLAFSRPAAAQHAGLQGWLAMSRGHPEQAEAHFQRAVDLMLPRQHAQSPHLAGARADLAWAVAVRGDRARATVLLAEARAAFAAHPAVGAHLRRGLAEAEKRLARR